MKLDVMTDCDLNTLLEDDYHFKAYGVQYTIPYGFTFDGWSIPRPLWFISHPLYYPYLEAFLIHDWFYETGHISRLKADWDFAKRVAKINKFKGALFFIAVRIFWFRHYK